MPRYFFNVVDGRKYTDVKGSTFSGLDALRKEAIGFASDLVRIEPDRHDWGHWTVRVTDEDGEQVLLIPLQQAPGLKRDYPTH